MNIPDILMKLWPLLVLQLILAVVALLDIRKRKVLKYLPRWVWIVIVVIGEMLGPIIYFAVGRGEE